MSEAPIDRHGEVVLIGDAIVAATPRHVYGFRVVGWLGEIVLARPMFDDEPELDDVRLPRSSLASEWARIEKGSAFVMSPGGFQ